MRWNMRTTVHTATHERDVEVVPSTNCVTAALDCIVAFQNPANGGQVDSSYCRKPAIKLRHYCVFATAHQLRVSNFR